MPGSKSPGLTAGWVPLPGWGDSRIGKLITSCRLFGGNACYQAGRNDSSIRSIRKAIDSKSNVLLSIFYSRRRNLLSEIGGRYQQPMGVLGASPLTRWILYGKIRILQRTGKPVRTGIFRGRQQKTGSAGRVPGILRLMFRGLYSEDRKKFKEARREGR